MSYQRTIIPHGTPQWHSFRSRGLGGSEIASVLGIDPYRCSLELFHQKLSLAPKRESNQQMHWGNALEDTVADAWKYWNGTEAGWLENRKAGTKVRKCRRMRGYVTRKEYPHLFFSPDRVIPANQFGYNKEGDWFWFGKTGGYLECKTIDKWAYSKLDYEIPVHYTAQVQAGMLMLGCSYGELAILIGGNEFKVFPLYRDEDWIAEIVERTREFWDKVEKARRELERSYESGETNLARLREDVEQFEPKPSETEMAAYCSYIGIAYQEEGEGMAEGEPWQLAAVKRHKAWNTALKETKGEGDKKKAELIRMIQATGCEGIDFGNLGKCTYKPDVNGVWRLNNTIKL